MTDFGPSADVAALLADVGPASGSILGSLYAILGNPAIPLSASLGSLPDLEDAVYYDATVGVPGTAWPIGTPGTPSNTLADIRTMCAARNVHTIVVHGALTLDAAMDGYAFVSYDKGPGDAINLNGKSTNFSTFTALSMSGAMVGYGVFRECSINNITNASCMAIRCDILGLTCGSGVGARLCNCYSRQVGTVNINTGGNPLLMTDWVGILQISGVTAGTAIIMAKDSSPITLDNTNTGGVIALYGDIILTDLSAGSAVLDFTLRGLLATIVGYEGATSLANKLTAARAALLDRLSIIAAGGAGELTAARAGYLDDLPLVKVETDQIGAMQNTGGVATLGAMLGDFSDVTLVTMLATLLSDILLIPTTPMLAANGALEIDLGNAQPDTIKSANAKIGNIARALSVILGSRWNVSGDVGTDIAAIIANIGDMSGDHLTSLKAKFGNDTVDLATRLATLLSDILLIPTAPALASSWTAALATILGNFTAARIGYLDNINQAGLLQVTAARMAGLDDIYGAVGAGMLSTVYDNVGICDLDTLPSIKFKLGDGPLPVLSLLNDGTIGLANIESLVTAAAQQAAAAAALAATVYTRQAGVPQTLQKTFDLHQAANTYTIFTATTQDVLIDSLTWRQTGGAPGGAVTSISIRTDDATPSVFISATDGAVANLVNQVCLGWASLGSKVLLKAGKHIQITIAGGAAAAANVNDIVVDFHAATSGGFLA